jgi:hypothetical protein
MKPIIVIAILATSLAAAFAEDLTWNELARRPELWPAHCKVKTAMKFEGGLSVQAGQKVDVVEFKGSGVDLKTSDGRLNFAAEQDETDVLDVAREAWTKLTPKQRALTYAALARQRELWPEHVTVTRPFNVAPGKVIQSGEQLVLEEVQPDKLLVKSEAMKARFMLTPPATDLMAQARQFVESESGVSPRYLAEKQAQEERLAAKNRAEEKRKLEGPVVTELEGKLVSSVNGRPEPLDTNALPRYIVFLRGSSTCPITRGFTPTLVRFYEEEKSKHRDFEVVWLMTETQADTSKFARELGFSWRALDYDSQPAVPTVNRYIDGKLPQLIVMDRSGKVLANGIQTNAPGALKRLGQLLEEQ